MYEVEVKVPADHEPVRERLSELDAESLGTVQQVDTYYDAPHRDFETTDEALRIREETQVEGVTTVTRLTYKGPKVDSQSKTRAEHESSVGDADAINAALTRLGFEPVAEVTKIRERYAWDGYTVTLDVVDGLGEFVEVEREATKDEIESARDGALDILESLSLEPTASVRTSYLGLLLDASE